MEQKANNVADMNELMKVLSHVESLIDTGRDDSEIGRMTWKRFARILRPVRTVNRVSQSPTF